MLTLKLHTHKQTPVKFNEKVVGSSQNALTFLKLPVFCWFLKSHGPHNATVYFTIYDVLFYVHTHTHTHSFVTLKFHKVVGPKCPHSASF